MERKVASDYPQELLDLFHEYQHGDIDRRTFLDGAAKFAVGGLTAAATFARQGVEAILIERRPAFDVPGVHLASPATSANSNGQSWFKTFVNALGGSANLRADYLAIHWYGWNSGSCTCSDRSGDERRHDDHNDRHWC